MFIQLFTCLKPTPQSFRRHRYLQTPDASLNIRLQWIAGESLGPVRSVQSLDQVTGTKSFSNGDSCIIYCFLSRFYIIFFTVNKRLWHRLSMDSNLREYNLVVEPRKASAHTLGIQIQKDLQCIKTRWKYFLLFEKSVMPTRKHLICPSMLLQPEFTSTIPRTSKNHQYPQHPSGQFSQPPNGHRSVKHNFAEISEAAR